MLKISCIGRASRNFDIVGVMKLDLCGQEVYYNHGGKNLNDLFDVNSPKLQIHN